MARVAGAVALAATLVALAPPARAEPLPAGSLGLLFGVFSGTGPDARRVGYGYLAPWPPSFHAAWQPMSTERRYGFAVRWSTIFHETLDAEAAQVEGLRTMQMDLTVGLRLRPGTDVGRYFTIRTGPALFRANQTIPPKMHRAFAGAVASVGFEQYLFGAFLLDFDVRYGLIATGPSEIVFTVGASIVGP